MSSWLIHLFTVVLLHPQIIIALLTVPCEAAFLLRHSRSRCHHSVIRKHSTSTADGRLSIESEKQNTATTKTSHVKLWGWSLQSDAVLARAKEGDKETINIHCQDTTNNNERHNSGNDLSSPREWLEYWEDKCQTPGVYTVLRSDYNISSGVWNTWGLEFHLNRLQESFECLLGGEHSPTQQKSAKVWREQSIESLHVLLSQTKEAIRNTSQLCEERQQDFNPSTETIITAMVTILWQPQREADRKRSSDKRHDHCVLVKAHVCSSLNKSPLISNAEPIKLLVALPTPDLDFSTLPSRTNNFPEAKLSSWCRERRPLEEMFKKPGIGEVLLVNDVMKDTTNRRHNVVLLEGLVSNVFFVYKEGILKTAQSGVLKGFARHLVLKYARECGLELADDCTVTIDDCDVWEEVFVTSSIRIITPVAAVLIIDSNGLLAPIWINKNQTRPYWKRLLPRIIAGENAASL